MTLNEVRDRENLAPADGGDSLFRPLNFAPIDGPVDVDDGTPPDPPPEEPGGSGHLDDDCPEENARSGDDLTAHIMETHAAILTKELERLWRVERDRITRYRSRPDTLQGRAETFYSKHRGAMIDALRLPIWSAARALSALEGHEFEKSQKDAYCRCLETFADGWLETSLANIKSGTMPNPDLDSISRGFLEEVAKKMKEALP